MNGSRLLDALIVLAGVIFVVGMLRAWPSPVNRDARLDARQIRRNRARRDALARIGGQ